MAIYFNNQKISGVIAGTASTSTADATLTNAGDLRAGVVAYGLYGKVTGSMPDLAATTYTPTTTDQTIAAGKYIAGIQTIKGDADLVPGNIKSGVDIFGVTGTYAGAGASLQAKTGITPTTSSQTITPDSGYDGLSSVQINAIQTETKSATPSTTAQTITPTSGKYLTSVSISAIQTETKSATPSTTAQTITPSTGKYLTSVSIGAIQTETKSATPSASAQTITPTSGKYLTSVSIAGDSDLVAGNIKSGVNIFGVTGTYSGSGGTTINNRPSISVTPTESSQTIGFDSSTYTGLSEVVVDAIPSDYVGSGITQRSSTDLTASGATVTVPAGYYSAQATKSVSSMTLPTAVASSATSGYSSKISAGIGRSTSDQYINIPPGYNASGAYYKINAVANGSVTAPSSISGTTATLTTGTNTLTLTKTVSVTPNVTTAGYISAGTAGNSSVSLTANVTVNPTPTASEATVTIPAGYYSAQTTKSVTTMTLPTSAASSATSGYTSKATISRSTADQYINIPPGYNSAGGYYKINAVANGSATNSGSASGSSATVSTGTNTLTLTKSVSITPTVTAGYISAGTAGNVSVALTASVTTKAAATITPGVTNQTIASGTYLTGTQTIAGDADLVAANIKNGVQIFGVTGSYTGLDTSDATATTEDIVAGETAYVNGSKITGELVLQTYYTGSNTPAANIGINGDIYLQS